MTNAFLDIQQDSEVVATPVLPRQATLDITQTTSVDFRVSSPSTLEPISGLKGYRILIVDKDGNQYQEIAEAQLQPLKWAINDMGSFSFTVPTNSPNIEDLTVSNKEVQVWRNGRLLWWGVITGARSDVNQVSFMAKTLEWYFSRRVMGPIPRLGHFYSTHFEAGAAGWSKRRMPGTLPAAPPNWSIGREMSLIGDHLILSSTNTTVQTNSVASFFTSNTSSKLKNAAKTLLTTYAGALVGTKPRVCVQVYSGGDLDDGDADDQTQDQADAIRDYLENAVDKIKVDAVGMGNQYHIDTTATSAGRANNRRVVITYLTTEGAHGQYFSQSFLVRVPAKHRHRMLVTMRGWVYVDSYVGPAMHNWGMVLERQNPRQLSKDTAYSDQGYNRVVARRVVTITDTTVKRRWIRVEASLRVPNDGKWWKIEGRLHPPSGTVFWDEVDVLTDDALDYVNVEQAKIIKDLVKHAQDTTIGKSDLNIGLNVSKTGIKRTRRYPYAERSIIADHLNEFSTLGDGMEWDIQITPTTRTFTTYYQRKAVEVDYELVLGANVLDASVDVNGELTSDVVLVMMNMNDTAAREERAIIDTSLLDGLVLETAYLATPGSSLSSLRRQAMRGIERYRKPVTTPSVTIRGDHADEALARLFPGAIVPVDVRAGWFETITKYRISDMSLDPSTDQITATLVPEDTPIRILSRYSQTWKYTHAAVTTLGQPEHPEYAAPTFDDSAWSTGTAGFGWYVTGDGSTTRDYIPATTVTSGHAVWMRKVVPVTEEMYVSVRNERRAWVYVNGNFVHLQHGRNWDNHMAPYRVRVPSEYLDPSGQQVVMVYAQAEDFGTGGPYGLYVDCQVSGIFDSNHVVP